MPVQDDSVGRALFSLLISLPTQSVTLFFPAFYRARASLMITLFGKPEPTLLERLKESVGKTKEALADTLDTITQGGRQIDPSVLKEVETALLSADLGVKTTKEILDSVREQMSRNALNNGDQLKKEIIAHVFRALNVFGNTPKLAGPANGN